MSDMAGKAARVGASERGQRTSFNGANGLSDTEGNSEQCASFKSESRKRSELA
ncbi:MAG: hypothetical protein QOE96_3071 [Blastocatellia bacterium]|nr:hypothetical protein [Blastocatellia bacterium]